MRSNILHDIPNYDGIGIYAITNNRTGRKYIGSSKNIKKRLLQHKSTFEKLTCSLSLKEDIQNGDTFSASILEKLDYGVNQFYIFERETYYIQLHDALNTGHNHSQTTASTKEELLQSLAHFQDNSEMTLYIQNIIKKRETPILKDTVFKRQPIEPYKSIRVHLPQSIYNSLDKHLDSTQDKNLDAFILRAILETMEREKPAATESKQSRWASNPCPNLAAQANGTSAVDLSRLLIDIRYQFDVRGAFGSEILEELMEKARTEATK